MKISDHKNMAEMEGHVKRSSSNKNVSPEKSEAPVKTEREGNAVAGSDNVRLSAKARELQEARKAVEATPELRKEKVEELKDRIASGSYNVKGEEIADAIIKATLVDKTV